jgi:hypothetical protein
VQHNMASIALELFSAEHANPMSKPGMFFRESPFFATWHSWRRSAKLLPLRALILGG